MRRRRVRPLRPPLRHRTRRWLAIGFPRASLAVHRARSAVQPSRAAPFLGGRPIDPVVEVIGNTTLLQVLQLGPSDQPHVDALRRRRAWVACIEPSDLERVRPTEFDLAVLVGRPPDGAVLVAALLERVQLVVTDLDLPAGPGVEHHANGLRLVSDPCDVTVNGVRYRSQRTTVRSLAATPLTRRRRYVEAVHPFDGRPVIVKAVRTVGPHRASERRQLRSEYAAYQAVAGVHPPLSQVPRLIDAEIDDDHGTLVLSRMEGRSLADPTLVIGGSEAHRVLSEIVRALVDLLERTGLHHNDVHEANVGIGSPCVLFDLGHASPRRREPFAAELARLASAIRDRMPPGDHAAWDRLVAGLPTEGPRALLAHLEREINR